MDKLDNLLEKYEQENTNGGEGSEATEIQALPPTTETTETTEVVNDEVLNYFKENGITHTTREELKPYFDKAKNFDAETEKYKLSSTELSALKVREAELTEKITFLKDFEHTLLYVLRYLV